ncbi:SDR family NAD(P)-dependent oxidoreductase [Amycolatopsis benzoatilytica]|uniref:SDR family NAD(P)-dependent oxidoreductase n=1 Tax=Amycolatopsis benzoatilytica TaxID=346045 RepID=UPI0003666E40|nr:SDR family NAD(P)-dependent oxidoreductase [Amycolatopsis benzoatilytica]
MRLKGKTAVITGGTRGLGRAIAERYLVEGASVVCASRSPHEVKELVDEVPDRVVYHEVEVADPASVDGLMRFAVDTFGRLDIVVANAGVHRDAKVERLDPAHWNEMVGTNLTGVYLCTRAAVPHLRQSGGGRIINVSSLMAGRVAVGAAGYCATKAAVEMLTRVSAIELGPKGILVNCLSPGFIDEGMGQAVASNDKLWQTYRRRLALGRAGQASELADAAVFLAGGESTYINGHVLEVNGGLLWA